MGNYDHLYKIIGTQTDMRSRRFKLTVQQNDYVL